MTTQHHRTGAASTYVHADRRSDVDVLLDQLDGILAWTSCHQPGDLPLDASMPREGRLDLVRRRDVVERQRRALIDWTDSELRASGDRQLRMVARKRAVIAHRNSWFADKVARALSSAGVTVVATVDNGAEAVGIMVAEQPDVVVVEHRLPMVGGLDVTHAARLFAPATVVVAQVDADDEQGPFLAAGAAGVYSRRIPPSDVAADVVRLLAGDHEVHPTASVT